MVEPGEVARQLLTNRMASLDPIPQNRYVFCLKSNSTMTQRFAPLTWLVALAILELMLNRGLVPMISRGHATATWLTALDYVSLFTFYFATTLALVAIGKLIYQAWQARRLAPAGWLLATALVGLAGVAVRAMVSAGPTTSLLLDFALLLVILAALLFAFLHGPAASRDVGLRIGMVAVSVPLLIHCVAAVYAGFVSLDAVAEAKDHWQNLGVVTMCVAAMLSPYCFAPRPFARAVVRIMPVVAAMAVATAGALLLRHDYVTTAWLVERTLGIEISTMRADPTLAFYLLAFATVMWSVVSALTSATAARRQVGVGLLLLVLGGNGFRWPLNYLLIALGLALLAYATGQVRAAERVAAAAPAIDDAVWSSYVASLAKALRVQAPTLHVLSTRDTDAEVSTLLIGDVDHIGLRVRMARRNGSLEMIDVLLGREPRRKDAPTLLLFGQSPLGAPVGVPLAAGARSTITADAIDVIGPLDVYAQLRGEGVLPGMPLGDIPGWIGYWPQLAIGWRVLPGRDASFDFPVPIHDLAHSSSSKNAAQNADRLAAVVATLIALAQRADLPRAEVSAQDGPAVTVAATSTTEA